MCHAYPHHLHNHNDPKNNQIHNESQVSDALLKLQKLSEGTTARAGHIADFGELILFFFVKKIKK